MTEEEDQDHIAVLFLCQCALVCRAWVPKSRALLLLRLDGGREYRTKALLEEHHAALTHYPQSIYPQRQVGYAKLADSGGSQCTTIGDIHGYLHWYLQVERLHDTSDVNGQCPHRETPLQYIRYCQGLLHIPPVLPTHGLSRNHHIHAHILHRPTLGHQRIGPYPTISIICERWGQR